MIFRPLFNNNHTELGNYLVEAENEEEALALAVKYFNSVDRLTRSYVAPNQRNGPVAVKKICFKSGVALL